MDAADCAAAYHSFFESLSDLGSANKENKRSEILDNLFNIMLNMPNALP
jgi:hypothetical protein